MTRSKDNLAAPARATPSHSRTPSPRPNANVGQTDGTATKKIPKRLVALMQELQSRLKEDPIFQSNAFESVHQGLTKAIAATEELSKIGDQTVSNKTWDVAALSFSKVKSSELERLGLHLHAAKRIPRSVQLVEMLKAMYARGTESSIMSIADRFSCSETSQRMQGMLEVIGRSLGMMRETTARIIIDQLLLSIFVFLWESDDHIVLLLFTELWISSEADSIVIYNGSNATLVTGLADYAVINISIGAQSNSDATTSAALTQVKSLTDLLKSAVWKQYSESSDGVACQITLVEAKSLIHTDDLEKFYPQVSTQALATMSQTGTEVVPWCLTTGTRWIFGIVCSSVKRVDGAYGHLNKTHVLMLEPLDLDLKSGEKKMAEAVGRIIPVLLAWLLCDPEEIRDTFFANELKQCPHREVVPGVAELMDGLTI